MQDIDMALLSRANWNNWFWLHQQYGNRATNQRQVPWDCSGIRAVISSDLHMSYQNHANASLKTFYTKECTYTQLQISSEYFNFATNKTWQNPVNLLEKSHDKLLLPWVT